MNWNGAAGFLDVGTLDGIPPGTSLRVTFPDTALAVAVFNIDGRLFAHGDECVRCGGSLGRGELLGPIVWCPDCDWAYDVRTGCVRNIPALRTDAFEVRVLDSRVMVAPTVGLPPGVA